MILEYLSFSDLVSLRTVFRIFLPLINPRIFSHIGIQVYPQYLRKNLRLIETISTSFTAITASIKTLDIGAHFFYLESEEKVSLDREAAHTLLSTCLIQFIAKLKNLETVL